MFAFAQKLVFFICIFNLFNIIFCFLVRNGEIFPVIVFRVVQPTVHGAVTCIVCSGGKFNIPVVFFQKKREQPATQINIVIRFEYSAFVILFPLPPCDPFARFGHDLHQSLCARTRYGIRSKKTFRSYDCKYKAWIEIVFFART